MRQLEKFDLWRCAEALAEHCYRLTMSPPLSRHFAVADQIRLSAISIPANVAEGYALSTSAQFRRHLRIALGSAAELRAHLRIARRLELLSTSHAEQAITQCERAISMIVGLLRRLDSRPNRTFPFPVSRFPTTGPNPERPSSCKTLQRPERTLPAIASPVFPETPVRGSTPRHTASRPPISRAHAWPGIRRSPSLTLRPPSRDRAAPRSGSRRRATGRPPPSDWRS